MAIDTENKSRSVLANGVLALVVPPTSIGVSDSPHICGWFNGDGFPLEPPTPETGSGGLRGRYSGNGRYQGFYRARYL